MGRFLLKTQQKLPTMPKHAKTYFITTINLLINNKLLNHSLHTSTEWINKPTRCFLAFINCDNLFGHSSKASKYPISKPAVLKLFGLRILYQFQKLPRTF